MKMNPKFAVGMKIVTVSMLMASSFMASAQDNPPIDHGVSSSSEALTGKPLSAVSVTKNTDAVERLRTHLKTINTYSSGFTQMTYEEDGYLLDETSGTMAFAKPGKLRWIATEPFSQTLIADGEKIFLFDPDLNQVTVRPWSDDPRLNPAVLFVSGDDLTEAFSVLSESTGEVELFQLRPHEEGGAIRQLDVQFEGGLPQQMTIHDSLGQKTEIVFTDGSINQEMPQGHFTFSVPESAEVIWDG